MLCFITKAVFMTVLDGLSCNSSLETEFVEILQHPVYRLVKKMCCSTKGLAYEGK